MEIVITENGCVNKQKILDIHNNIKNKLIKTQTIKNKIHLDYGFYIIRVHNFLKSLNFNKAKNIIELFKQDTNIKINLEELMCFISIAREYVNIDIKQDQTIICPFCNMMNMIEKVEGELICEECGYIYDTRLPGIKDFESVNTCRSYYSLRSNLLKAINKFDGKNFLIPQVDLDKIKQELTRRTIPFETLKCDHIIKILKDIKLTKYYDDAFSILLKITNRKHISIQKYIPELLKLHDELEFAYSIVKDKDRINSLNVQFKLFKLLKQCNIDCDISDFCTLKTEQKYEEHEKKWREICQITGWKI